MSKGEGKVMPRTAHRYSVPRPEEDTLCYDCQNLQTFTTDMWCPIRETYIYKGFKKCLRVKIMCEECGGFGIIDEKYTPCPVCGGTGYENHGLHRKPNR